MYYIRFFQNATCGMKIKFLNFFLFSLVTISCLTTKNKKTTLPVQQGIEGFVYKRSGNLMPYPNRPPQNANGFSTVLYIYEPTNIKDVDRKETSAFYFAIHKKLISTVQSDSTGHFRIGLPTGSYSLFTKVGNLLYGNTFDAENNIDLVTVNTKKITQTTIKVDLGTTY